MIDRLPKELFPEHNTLLFFDTETTGLDPKDCNVIELGAVQYIRDETGDWIRNIEMSDLIRLPEGKTIPENVSKINNITDEMLREQGIARNEAFSKFSDMIGEDTLLIAYNTYFDYKFLLYEFERCFHEETPYGERLFSLPIHKLATIDIYDAMLTARARVIGTDVEGKPIRHRLGNMLDYYNIEGVENNHRALGDVEALISLTKAFVEEKNDLSDSVNRFPYYSKYPIPSGIEEYVNDMSKFSFMDENAISHSYEVMHILDLSSVIEEPPQKGHYRYDVPEDIMPSIETAWNKPDSKVVFAERADCEHDQGHLYHFIARDRVNRYVFGTYDAKINAVTELSSETYRSFSDAKSNTNSKHIDEDGFYPSINDLSDMSAMDQIAQYFYAIEADSTPCSYLDIYKRIDQTIIDGKPVNLLYAALDTKSYIELSVNVDLSNHRYSVEANSCLIGYGTYEDNKAMMNDFTRIHGDPLSSYNIKETYNDVAEERVTAYNLAYCLWALEHPDEVKENPHWIDDFEGQHTLSKLAQDITDRPHYYAERVDEIAHDNPVLSKEVQAFKDIMDKLCDHLHNEPVNCSLLFEDSEELQFDCHYFVTHGERFSLAKYDGDRTE